MPEDWQRQSFEERLRGNWNNAQEELRQMSKEQKIAALGLPETASDADIAVEIRKLEQSRGRVNE